MSNNEIGHPCLLSSFSGKTFNLSPLCVMLDISSFFLDTFFNKVQFIYFLI